MKPVAALAKLPPLSTLLRNDPFLERVQQMHDMISRRAYELFEKGGQALGRELEDWFRAESELLQPVPLELSETDDAFKMRAEVPGLNEKEIEIKVDPHRVFIAGKHEVSSEKKKGKTVHSERSRKEIFREYYLPAEIDPDKVTAELRGGVLEIGLPKLSKTKKIAVTGKAA